MSFELEVGNQVTVATNGRGHLGIRPQPQAGVPRGSQANFAAGHTAPNRAKANRASRQTQQLLFRG